MKSGESDDIAKRSSDSWYKVGKGIVPFSVAMARDSTTKK